MTFENNIIFLDFDGVVTAKCNGTYFCSDCSKYSYSESHVRLLEDLCLKTNSKIIIASNWRKFDDDGSWTPFPGKTYVNPLPRLRKRLGDLVVGELPLARHKTKSEALEIWFMSNSVSEKFVILDDDLSEGYQYSRFSDQFVFVNSEFGLTSKVCEQCMEKLK